MDKHLLDILVCPLCKGKLVYQASTKTLICRFDKLAYPIKNGIPVMLANEAQSLQGDEIK